LYVLMCGLCVCLYGLWCAPRVWQAPAFWLRLVLGRTTVFLSYYPRFLISLVYACVITVSEGTCHFICGISCDIYRVFIVLPPIIIPPLQIGRWVLFSVLTLFVFVGSNVPDFRVYFFCGGSSWDVAGGCVGVSAFF
jgi:hypothetical protein